MTAMEVLSKTWSLGDLPRLIRESDGLPATLEALATGHGATMGGPWGSSCALVAARLAELVPRTLFVVTAHVSDVDNLCDDIASFLGRGRAADEKFARASADQVDAKSALRATIPSFPAWD